MLKGLGATKSRIKIVSELETDCDPQTKGAHAAQTMLTANPHLTAIYSACGPPALGAIQSIKNAGIEPGGIILVGFDPCPTEVKGDQGRDWRTHRVAQHPDKIGSLGIATLYSAVLGQDGAQERRHGHLVDHTAVVEVAASLGLAEHPPREARASPWQSTPTTTSGIRRGSRRDG